MINLSKEEQDENNSNSSDSLNDNQYDMNLKRKRSTDIIDVNRLKIIKTNSNSSSESPSSSSSSSSSISSASPTNWYETNLQLINDMLETINKKNNTQFHISNGEDLNKNLNHKQDLKMLCESIKDKLQKNAYECLDDLNNDLKIFKDKFTNDCVLNHI